MFAFDQEHIRAQVADSEIIFSRGRKIYEYGSYMCQESDFPHMEEQASGTSQGEARPAVGESQTPEKMEEVLNTGISFISGLLEMATGQKLTPGDDQERLLTLDQQTGEMTMKFKLPGF